MRGTGQGNEIVKRKFIVTRLVNACKILSHILRNTWMSLDECSEVVTYVHSDVLRVHNVLLLLCTRLDFLASVFAFIG